MAFIVCTVSWRDGDGDVDEVWDGVSVVIVKVEVSWNR